MTEDLLKIVNKYVERFAEQNRIFNEIEPQLRKFYSSESFKEIKKMQFSFQQEIYTIQMIILSSGTNVKSNKKEYDTIKKEYDTIEKLLDNYKVFIETLQKNISVNDQNSKACVSKTR